MKLQVLIRQYPMVSPSNINPFGDYGAMLSITTRKNSEIAPEQTTLLPSVQYFKVSNENGFIVPMTREEFVQQCEALALSQSKSSQVIEL